ncbi:CAAX amino terminal protease family [Methanosarcina barkeri str. Wiesmoor]|uniref:CAAX amino terminal protease family n=2 Tax=Methanosarcina barkeri TaxID=2208 RepID=A0A0E3QLS0_METBA|nr:CPBP family glutamic-type intramembrane protease [Methanosarcina barkeri]AKB50924.1 CAAX amino terminal protease family [Methanosarcina barkeri str. Wiesmoor]
MNKKVLRNTVVFIVLVILSGWIGFLVDSTLPEQPKGDSPGMGIWLVLPMLTAVAITIFSRGNWKDFGFKPNFKGNIKWYLIAALIFPVVTAAVLIIGVTTKWIDLSTFDFRPLVLVFSSTLLFNFIKNIFDGAPLHGYLTSQLLKLDLNDWKIYLIVGGLWGIWHIPYYLIFLPETDIQAVLPVNRTIFSIFMTITIVFWAVMFVELYRITKSIWPGIILHMVEDSLINPLVISGFISIAAGKEILISPIFGIITTILYLLVGLGIRAYRKQASQIMFSEIKEERSFPN